MLGVKLGVVIFYIENRSADVELEALTVLVNLNNVLDKADNV